jgi:hypothetical protein
MESSVISADQRVEPVSASKARIWGGLFLRNPRLRALIFSAK